MAIVNLNKNGFQRASFNEIVNYISDWYKRVYGTDIDIAAGTADGDFIQQLALMMTDITSVEQNIFANLDITTAQGKMLDVLCALGNVFRKPASYSYASLIIENAGSSTFTANDHLDFIDTTGTVWRYTGRISLASGAEQTITAYCTEIGAIEAPAGSITKTMMITQLNVSQPTAAIIGNNAETDAELRNRKQNADNAFGVTTLDSIISALRKISGVEDVKIYNNNSANSWTSADGTSIPAHNIYVIVRKNTNADLDEQIGSTIYDKLTPGIVTTAFNSASTNPYAGTGTAKTYAYIASTYDVVDADNFVKWKEAIPVHNDITVNCTFGTGASVQQIVSAMSNVIEWLNSRPIGETLNGIAIAEQVQKYAPKIKGRPVLTVDSVTFADRNVRDTYCNYSIVNMTAGAILFGGPNNG